MRFEKRFLMQRLFFIGFWLATCTGFVSDLFWQHGESSILYTVSLLTVDVILLFLAICTIRKAFDIILISSFLVISFSSTCILNHSGFFSWINGLRYFFGMLFLVPILRYFWTTEFRHDLFVKSLDKQLYIFLWLQVPAVLFQFFVHGAGDRVGGTMGDGFSGVISISIYLTSFYLLSKRIDRNNVLQSLYKNWIYIFLLFPTFLNETKISFILLVVYLILLMPLDRKYIIRMTFLVPVIALLLGVGSYFYMSTVTGSERLELSEEFFESYFDADLDDLEGAMEYAEKNYSEMFDVPRLAKFAIIPMVFTAHPGHHLLGFGTNIYAHGAHMEATEFYEEYDWLLNGTSPWLFSIYMQLGIIGTIWSLAFFLSLFFRKHPIYNKRNLNAQFFLFVVIFVMFFYSDHWGYANFCYMALIFHFLSWNKVEDTMPANV
ncbi:MAG: hypothetical protein IK100_10060 [Muribaculaceae bacterium]|nr:hypothetical protein [Muribaculaceae bacterium]